MRNNDNYKVGPTPDPFSEMEDGGGLFSFFDPENPDINLFNLVDDEMIKISGSPLLYYPYIQGDTQYDDVYMEAQNKTISKDPILVYGHYEPKVVEEQLSQFGIQMTNDQIFTFNKSYIENKLRREIIPGDIIKPKFQNQKYEIFEVQEDSFELYGVYHLTCSAKLLRDAPDVQDTPLTKTGENLGLESGIKSMEDTYDEI